MSQDLGDFASLPKKQTTTPAASDDLGDFGALPKRKPQGKETGLDPSVSQNLASLRSHLRDLGITPRITSGRRTRAQQDALGGGNSDHLTGKAIDFVTDGDMAEVARKLRAAGYRVQFERKGQRNKNGSVASGDHIHAKLDVAPPARTPAKAQVKKPLYDAEFAASGPKRGKDDATGPTSLPPTRKAAGGSGLDAIEALSRLDGPNTGNVPLVPAKKVKAEQAKKDQDDRENAKVKAQQQKEKAKASIRSQILKKPTRPQPSVAQARLQRDVANKPATNPNRSKELREEVNQAKDFVAKKIKPLTNVASAVNPLVPLPFKDEASDLGGKIFADLLFGVPDSVAEVGTIANPEEDLNTRARAVWNVAGKAIPVEEILAGAAWKAGREGILNTASRLGSLGTDANAVQALEREAIGRLLMRPQGEIKGIGRATTKAVEKTKGPVQDTFNQRASQKTSAAPPLPPKIASSGERVTLTGGAEGVVRSKGETRAIVDLDDGRQVSASLRDIQPAPPTTPGIPTVPTTGLTPAVTDVPVQIAPVKVPDTKYAASNAATTDARARVGMDPAAPNIVPNVDARATYDPALTLTRVRQALDDVSKGRKPAPLNDVETKHIAYAVADQEKAYNDVTARIAQAVERGEDVRPLQELRNQIEKDFDDLTTGSRYIGTEQGRALAARNVASLQDYTPAGLYREWQATAGRKLDPTLQKKADDLGLKLEEANLRIRQMEEEAAQRQAQMNIRTGRSGGAKVPKEAVEKIRAKRADAAARLKEKWAASSRDTVVMSDPLGLQTAAKFFGRLSDIAPEVREIAESFLEEGTVKFSDVVRGVRETLQTNGLDLEDGDIHRILAGEYDRPTKPTMSEAQKRLAELRKAAKDTDAARNARAARLAPKRQQAAEKAADIRKTRRQMAEEAKAERQRLAAARAEGRKQAAAARKEYSDFWKQEVAEYEQWWKESIPGQREKIEEQIGRLEEMIAKKDFAPPQAKAKPSPELGKEIIRRKALEVEADEIRTALRVEREARERPLFAGLAKDALDFQRGLVASSDFSAPLNQGAFFAASRPITSAKAFAAMAKASKSPQALREIQGAVRANPHFDKARAAGLQLAVAGPDASSEMIVGRILGKIPLVNISDRAYTAYLTKLRMDTFANIVETMERPWMGRFGGKAPSLDELKQIAEYVNTATGVGTGKVAGGLKNLNQSLPVMFAPGYMVSRWKLALGSPAINAAIRRNPQLAAIIVKDYLKFASVLGGSLYLANQMGYESDFDPRSSKFGKVKIGETWVDPAGGILTPLRVAAQVSFGTKRNGKVQSPNHAMIAGYYGTGRISPTAKTASNILQGEAFGKSYDPKTSEGWKNILLSFAPIQGQQQLEIGSDQKLTREQLASLRIAAIFGANVNSPSPNYRQ